ncbi:DUF2291 family protein [Serratia rubidaea]|uniref:DUF2291 family protein n=1 Tax=Serratia rubidaea TaxID=61652 RepID=UPI0022B8BF3B|nr:DUF2291 domain-containing protein [Serratia rubidaea]WBF46188.1 DUF2291 domain-containing protein [Serratia rubidaea]
MFTRLGPVVLMFLLGGCRLVSPQELADLKNPPNPKMANIPQTWQQQIVPQIVKDAKADSALLGELATAKDFDEACQHYGYRSQAENPCLFSVRLSGVVSAVNRTSRSGKMTLKTAAGDEIRVKTGPIIRGTDLRDAYKGAGYQDFNDQVLFGDYGRAINQQAADMMRNFQPQVGDNVEVVGVFSSWALPDKIAEITPAAITRR